MPLFASSHILNGEGGNPENSKRWSPSTFGSMGIVDFSLSGKPPKMRGKSRVPEKRKKNGRKRRPLTSKAKGHSNKKPTKVQGRRGTPSPSKKKTVCWKINPDSSTEDEKNKVSSSDRETFEVGRQGQEESSANGKLIVARSISPLPPIYSKKRNQIEELRRREEKTSNDGYWDFTSSTGRLRPRISGIFLAPLSKEALLFLAYPEIIEKYKCKYQFENSKSALWLYRNFELVQDISLISNVYNGLEKEKYYEDDIRKLFRALLYYHGFFHVEKEGIFPLLEKLFNSTAIELTNSEFQSLHEFCKGQIKIPCHQYYLVFIKLYTQFWNIKIPRWRDNKKQLYWLF